MLFIIKHRKTRKTLKLVIDYCWWQTVGLL